MARERGEVSPPVRVHPCGSHIVVYVIEPDGSILIVRVRDAREDWIDDPGGYGRHRRGGTELAILFQGTSERIIRSTARIERQDDA